MARVTLLPWLALLLATAGWASIALSHHPGERSRPRSPSFALLLAVDLFAARSRLGGSDRFEDARRFMESRLAAGGQ